MIREELLERRKRLLEELDEIESLLKLPRTRPRKPYTVSEKKLKQLELARQQKFLKLGSKP